MFPLPHLVRHHSGGHRFLQRSRCSPTERLPCLPFTSPLHSPQRTQSLQAVMRSLQKQHRRHVSNDSDVPGLLHDMLLRRRLEPARFRDGLRSGSPVLRATRSNVRCGSTPCDHEQAIAEQRLLQLLLREQKLLPDRREPLRRRLPLRSILNEE